VTEVLPVHSHFGIGQVGSCFSVPVSQRTDVNSSTCTYAPVLTRPYEIQNSKIQLDFLTTRHIYSKPTPQPKTYTKFDIEIQGYVRRQRKNPCIICSLPQHDAHEEQSNEHDEN
jgi:hypothetical protein